MSLNYLKLVLNMADRRRDADYYYRCNVRLHKHFQDNTNPLDYLNDDQLLQKCIFKRSNTSYGRFTWQAYSLAQCLVVLAQGNKYRETYLQV